MNDKIKDYDQSKMLSSLALIQLTTSQKLRLSWDS